MSNQTQKSFDWRKMLINMDTERFIAEATILYGDAYTYPRTRYKNKSTPVEVVCKVHGMITVVPIHFLSGLKCGQCRQDDAELGDSPTIYTTERFIAEAIALYGDAYTYEKTKYTGPRVKVIVTCKERGDIVIKPCKHLRMADPIHLWNM